MLTQGYTNVKAGDAFYWTAFINILGFLLIIGMITQ